jgi:phosphate transport system protein
MHIDKELENLNQMLLKMGDLVTSNIQSAFKIYLKEKGEFVVNDDLVDSYERIIEEVCLNIILKERPYAKDLRQVTGILKLIADLERIGDHAEDIVFFSQKIDHFNDRLDQVKDMLEFVLKMLNDALLSYINKDLALAKDVIARDNEVDKFYYQTIERIVEETKKQMHEPGFAVYSTIIIKYLERIADHCTNISEWVVYIVSGYYKDTQFFQGV